MQITSLQQYQAESRKTAIYPGKDQYLYYPTLEVINESWECFNAPPEHILIEAGDVAWAIAQVCTEIGIDLEEFGAMDPEMPRISATYRSIVSRSLQGLKPIVTNEILLAAHNELSAHAKKFERDGRERWRQKELKATLYAYWCMFVDAESSFTAEYPDLWAILSANIAKLNDRMERNQIKGDGDDR